MPRAPIPDGDFPTEIETMSCSQPARTLPDVAAERGKPCAQPLDWVGMEGIEMPVLVATAEGAPQRLSARIAAEVSLDQAEARGIHMSRLYLLLDEHLAEPLTPGGLRRMVRKMLESQQGLSRQVRVSLRFEHLVRRGALASGHSGWRAYPVELTARMDGEHFRLDMAVDIHYSSTCPASAALARQLIGDAFEARFPAGAPLDRDTVRRWLGSTEGIVATPHAQRSRARVEVVLAPGFDLPLEEVIGRVEAALATPVQAAVKREDEQAFALANGQNLMFCEDAVRRIRGTLEDDERIAGYRVRVEHFESLHPHDAVAQASRDFD